MPAKKITTKARSTSKKGLFGKSFSLQSRKVQFFIFILVVGLIGGGFTVYKSFAASRTWTYSPQYGSFKISGDGIKDCKWSNVNDPSKNNALVLVIGCKSTILVPIRFIDVQAVPNITPSLTKNYYRACATVKGNLPWGAFRLTLQDGGQSYATNEELSKINTKNYTSVCTNKIWAYSTGTADIRFVIPTLNSQVSIANFILEQNP